MAIQVPQCSISRPRTRSPSPTASSKTNTLIITGLPKDLFHPLVLDTLRDHFATFGDIHSWAPIKCFTRIIVVFYKESDAEAAKLACDGFTVNAPSMINPLVLRVYRADPTTIAQPSPTDEYSPFHLRPPPIEKNFLISPPGSPPVGWEPIVEEPPNASPLADDLIFALRRLKVEREGGERGMSILVEPEEGSGVGVYVEDCDWSVNQNKRKDFSDHEETWVYGNSPVNPPHFHPMATMRPPMPMSV